MLKLNWVLLALITGLFFGHGVILVNAASRNATSLSTTLFFFGAVWAISSLPMVSASEVMGLSLRGVLLLVLAGLVFFVGNFFQFTATLHAPIAGFALLAITAMTFLVTFTYDAVRLHGEGKAIISLSEVVGVLLVAAGLSVLVLSSKK